MKAHIIYYGNPLPVPPDPKEIAIAYFYVPIALPLMGILVVGSMILLSPIITVSVAIATFLEFRNGDKHNQ